MKRGSARDSHAMGHAQHGMRPLKALIPFEEARRMAMDLVRPISRKENVTLLDAAGRIAAEEVRSKIDVPLADRAAMDGYAVIARDTSRAEKSRSVVLHRIEVLHADSVPKKRVTKGRCSEIATGSTMPAGADAVVRVEDTQRAGDRVTISVAVRPAQNVVERGADIERGSTVIRAGDLFSPAKVGAAAAIGLDRVRVYAKPRISILTTGDEIVAPGRPLRPGQVYDINSNTIASIVRENGGEPVLVGHLPDRLGALRTALRRGLANDFVVFSGGSSVGERDIVVDVIGSMGDVLFHGVAVKPGKPTSLGRVDGKPILGMPGYPTSCLTNGYVLLAPMLRRMARLPPSEPRMVEAPLGARIERATGRLEFHPVRIVDGQVLSAFRESSAITSMAHADGYLEIPADVERLEAGERVRVILF